MKVKRKTKQIEKMVKKNEKNAKQANQETKGQPELKSLSDFVTSLTSVYSSKPIYTGGRIQSSNGKIYASCNQSIIIYDISTKVIVSKIKHANQQIANFGVNNLGNRIATFTQNGLFRIIEVQTQKILQITKLSSKLFPNDISFSPDSKYIALGFASQLVKIFTVQTLKETHSYQHSAPVRKVQWNPNSQLLQVLSSDDGRKLMIFDYIANKVVGQVDGGFTFNFMQNGKRIATIYNKQIRIYEYKGLKLQQKFDAGEYLEALYVYDQTVFFGGEDSQLFLWKIGEQKIRTVAKGTDRGVMKILGWQKQKKCIVVSTQQNLTILNTKQLQVQDVIVGYNDQIIDIKYSKSNDSNYFLMITNSSNAKIMNRTTNTLHHLLQGHQDIILCCQYWHPWIITAGKDKLIKLWKLNEAATVHLIANYSGHSDDVCGIGWLPKSRLIVSVGQDKTIKIWPIYDSSNDLIEINSALLTVMGHAKTINSVRVSIKDQLIATCSHDRTVKIWDKNLFNIFTLSGHRRGVWDAAFHQKQALIVTAGGDGMLKGWSLIDGSCVWSMGQGAGLVRCQWIYEHQVVTGSVDGILKLWDVRKKTSLSYDKHEGKIWALEVRKNEKGKCEIATGANDSVYQIWIDSTQQTRQRILKQGQTQQKERIMLQQYKFEKKYLQAAKLAFDCNYTQTFMHILQNLLGKCDDNRQIEMNQQGAIIQEPIIPDIAQIDTKIRQLINYTLEKDSSKLFNVIFKMNSTIRHFKAANRLFIEILKQKKINNILQYSKGYSLQNSTFEIGQTETDFFKFIKNMQLYTEKHYQRIQKYVRTSYWIDHLEELQNPMQL